MEEEHKMPEDEEQEEPEEEKHKKPEDPRKCPDCGGEIINENGEKYCKKCGLVIEE